MQHEKFIEVPRVVIPGWAIAIIIGLLVNAAGVVLSYGSLSKQVDLLQQSFYRLEDRVNVLAAKGAR